MAGNDTGARQRAEREYKDALKDDPKGKNAATRTLKAAYNAAESVENQATGTTGQAKSWI